MRSAKAPTVFAETSWRPGFAARPFGAGGGRRWAHQAFAAQQRADHRFNCRLVYVQIARLQFFEDAGDRGAEPRAIDDQADTGAVARQDLAEGAENIVGNRFGEAELD